MITYNPKTKRYEDDGNPIEQAAIIALIHKLTDRAKVEAKRLTARLQDGSLSREQWQEAMQSLLTSAHIIAASVGKGGRDNVTDWSKVEKKIDWQAGFLGAFGAAVVAGSVSAARAAQRAASYADAAYVTFSNADVERKAGGEREMLCRLVQNSQEGCSECQSDAAEGWMPVSEMGELGTRECGDWCKCYIEFEDEI